MPTHKYKARVRLTPTAHSAWEVIDAVSPEEAATLIVFYGGHTTGRSAAGKVYVEVVRGRNTYSYWVEYSVTYRVKAIIQADDMWPREEAAG